MVVNMESNGRLWKREGVKQRDGPSVACGPSVFRPVAVKVKALRSVLDVSRAGRAASSLDQHNEYAATRPGALLCSS